MKAWRIHGIGDMRLDQVPEPTLDAGSVLVRVRVVQPSVTEVIRFRGNAARRSEQFRKLIDKGPVQLFGHEASGEVVDVAKGVKSLRTGDRVAIYSSRTTCGQCRYCRASLYEGCVQKRHIGQQIPGCFAEYAALPEECLVKLNDSVSDSEGATIQSVTSALKAVLAAGIQPADTVAVLGQGAMGLATTQLSKALGVRQVIATARRRHSIEISRELGADVVVNPGDGDAVATVMDLTGGVGVDIAFETAGGSTAEGLSGYETFFQAVQMTKPGGKVVVVSSLVEPVTIPGFQMFQGLGISVIFDSGFKRDMREFVVDMMASKRLRLDPTITHCFEGIEAVPKAFDVTGNKQRHGAVNPAQVVISRP